MTQEDILDTVVADITLDGNPDIVCDNGVIFPGHGDGTFGAPELFDWYAPDIHVVDFNRDGLPDVVAPYSDGSVQILVNERRDNNTAPTVDSDPTSLRVRQPVRRQQRERVLGARHRRGNAQADVPLDVSGRACR